MTEGLGGKTDIPHTKTDIRQTGIISTATLDLYVSERVEALTDGRQHPVMMRPATVPDFPIATVQ